MPKDRRERSVSLDMSILSPFPWSSNCSRQPLFKDPLEDDANIKEWEDARCPVCIEHPHNAILLICSSHEKGCRPFMCDTSYRHSNCFDQFQKSFAEDSATVQIPENVPNLISSNSEVTGSDLEGENIPENPVSMNDDVTSENPVKPKLVCPLCRGEIEGWTVVKNARRFMNAKSRSCASETCDFSGSYIELRNHARLIHPLLRPADVNPERQRNWRRMERQRDLGDLLSILQSSVGDERTEDSTLTINDDGWLTVFFLVRFIQPGNSSNRSRAHAQVTLRRRSARLWGETYNAESNSTEDDNGSSETVLDIPMLVRRSVGNTDEDIEPSASAQVQGSQRQMRYVRRRFNNRENQ